MCRIADLFYPPCTPTPSVQWTASTFRWWWWSVDRLWSGAKKKPKKHYFSRPKSTARFRRHSTRGPRTRSVTDTTNRTARRRYTIMRALANTSQRRRVLGSTRPGRIRKRMRCNVPLQDADATELSTVSRYYWDFYYTRWSRPVH